ncbi:Protein of unknown function [Propionibacterium freudenreichii]|nr:Protein of unknown function [Propionibacterium freudenreichii]
MRAAARKRWLNPLPMQP